jgi:formylglycine-generating enzyme required for sulfatase activity
VAGPISSRYVLRITGAWMPAGKVYLSYRRDDDPGYAHALRASLERELEVLMDVADAPKATGVPWLPTLERQMEEADVLLAVIGPRWEDRIAAADEQNDVVIDEIHVALEQGKRVIPVLVGNAEMPGPDRLPVRIRVLPLLHPFHVRPESMRMDTKALETEIGEIVFTREAWRGPGPAEDTLPLSLGHSPPAAGPGPWRFEPLDMPFVWVPAGEYRMGASSDPNNPGYDPGAFEDESPPHTVTLSDGFWLAQHVVTVAQYRRFCDETSHKAPSAFTTVGFDGPNLPITSVSWDDAHVFCEWMSRSFHEGWRVALPTEAQWEWAARGPEGRRYPWGSDPPDEFGAAIFGGRPLGNVGARPRSAGPFGTHDQAGLVWEWCMDAYAPYSPEPATDPLRIGDGPRVIRGGSWSLGPESLRATTRRQRPPSHKNVNLGFRVLLVAS